VIKPETPRQTSTACKVPTTLRLRNGRGSRHQEKLKRPRALLEIPDETSGSATAADVSAWPMKRSSH
jgi:hypothetical protein